jgi:hypothetical protein
VEYLLTDVDGVLLDWTTAFAEYMRSLGFKVPNTPPPTYKLCEWLGMTDAEILKHIHDFNESAAFSRVPAFDDAVSMLSFMAVRFKIVAISCCSESQFSRDNRVKNLKDKFGDIFADIVLLPLRVSKTEVLSKYPKGSIWVEDRFGYAKEGLELGMKTYLLSRPYNLGYGKPGITHCNSWFDVLTCVNNPGWRPVVDINAW